MLITRRKGMIAPTLLLPTAPHSLIADDGGSSKHQVAYFGGCHAGWAKQLRSRFMWRIVVMLAAAPAHR
jgi:hypothetical protein